MRSNEETIRAIFDASPDTIMLLDEHGFVDCNPATLRMFACYNAEEFLGRHPSEYSPPTQPDGRDSQEAADENIATAYELGSNLFEWTHQRSNGEVFPAEVQLTLLRLKDGEILQATVRDITERKAAEEKMECLHRELEQFSFQDGLTGTINRRMFDQELDREWNRAQRNRQPLSLIMIDIDFFKQYNDHYGHLQGDDCLKQVVQALSGVSKRAVDLLARYGGEEFILLLPETDADQAIGLAEKCRSMVAEQKFPHAASTVSDVVTISAGVSTMIPTANIHPASLINAADKLLYRAKNSGRNRIEYEET